MCVKLLELSALQQPFLSIGTSYLSKWVTHCCYFCLGNLWRCALTLDSTVPKGWFVQCFWNVKIWISKGLLCIFQRHMTGYMVWIVLSKQSLGNEREAVVGTAKKAKRGWLLKTDVGGKTQKLKREITDMWGEAWPNIDYRWLATVTVLGNEMWYFWLLVLENVNFKFLWKTKWQDGKNPRTTFQVLIT